MTEPMGSRIRWIKKYYQNMRQYLGRNLITIAPRRNNHTVLNSKRKDKIKVISVTGFLDLLHWAALVYI